MFWALVDNEKVEPTPNAIGICPQCGEKLFSKCGEINDWHWSHFKGENCEAWYEPESCWHKRWKMTFGKDNAEIRIEKDSKKHIADILTSENVVIELQNSPIKSSVIKTREDFYGKRMLWVINGAKFKENFEVWDKSGSSWRPRRGWLVESLINATGKEEEHTFNWAYARRSWSVVNRPVFIDFGEDSLFWVKEGMGLKHGSGTYVSKEKFIKKYGGDYEYFCRSIGESHSY